MTFYPTTEVEISAKIASLKKEGALDELSRRFLVLCKNHVAKIVAELINLCIQQEFFLDILKTANIVPIQKKIYVFR